MSFILDALKKSARERERQQQPTVMDIPYGRRSRTQPLWMLAVIALLVLNCILLLVMWWRNGHETPAASVPATSSVAATNTAPPAGRPPRAVEVRPLQDEAGSDTETAVADEAAAALADEATPGGPPLVRPATALEQAMARQQASATDLKTSSENRTLGISTDPGTLDNTPTLAALGGNGALSLPELRLDVHVYSPVAIERFAFINGRKYTEGQNLTEGPAVEKITQEGVVLAYRGKRFVLPRQ